MVENQWSEWQSEQVAFRQDLHLESVLEPCLDLVLEPHVGVSFRGVRVGFGGIGVGFGGNSGKGGGTERWVVPCQYGY